MSHVKEEGASPSRSPSSMGTPKPRRAKRRSNTWGTSKQMWFCFWCNASFRSKSQHLKLAPLQEYREGHFTLEELEALKVELSNGVMDNAYNLFLERTEFSSAITRPKTNSKDPYIYVETSLKLVEDFIIPQIDKCKAEVFIDLGCGTGHILSQVALKRPHLRKIRGFENDDYMVSLAEDWKNRLRRFIGLDSYTVERVDLASPALENTIDPYGIHGPRKLVYCNNLYFPQPFNRELATEIFPILPDGSIFMTVKPIANLSQLEGLLRPFECEVIDVPKTYGGMFASLKKENRCFFVYTML